MRITIMYLFRKTNTDASIRAACIDERVCRRRETAAGGRLFYTAMTRGAI